ncbi:TonB-dependent receptor [bacterium]|nr:TonB-dependent receptor [bacterium]
MKLPRFFLFLMLVGSVFLADSAHAYPSFSNGDIYGKIAGRIVEAGSGLPLPGVNVFIEGTTQGASTDANGEYVIIRIRPGAYNVRATFIGFSAQVVEGVQVEVDQTTRVNFTMAEEVFEGEEIVVTAERGIVQMDRTTTTAVVNADQLKALPVTTINDVVNLQAGVVDGRFRGGRSGEVAYLVNGVPINNVFNNQAAFEVEQNMVSSLQVISGVFNAEYGQAQSGIVNIVTKDVPEKWAAEVLSYAGTIASNREVEFTKRNAGPGSQLAADQFGSELVRYSDAAEFRNLTDLQLSFGGPIIKDKLGFQLSGRFLSDRGHLMGRELFMPSDSSTGLTSSSNPNFWNIESTGSGDFVSMGTNERYSLNGTLTSNLTRTTKLEYNLFLQDGEFRNYSHASKYVPGGLNPGYFGSQTHILSLRYTIGQKSFGTVSYSYLRDKYDSYLHDCTIIDEQKNLDCKGTGVYEWSQKRNLSGQNAFQVAGNDLYTTDELTETHTILADYSSQIGNVHLVKGGVMARLHGLNNRTYGIERSARTNNLPRVSPDVFSDNTLKVNPVELSAYIQDKMEFTGLIVNAGARFDYFDSDYLIPIDWRQAAATERVNPDNTAELISNREKAPAKVQLSPRLGIAFPISSTGVMRFSAGLFFQIPQLSLLYTNPEYEVNPASSSNQFGNPALSPERTLAFEVGLQQGLTDNIGLELTIFSKDVRNLTGQEVLRTPTGDFAVRWINRDYGTIRGVTFSLFDQPGGIVSWTVDYTLQFAEGTSSDPGEAFGRQQSGLQEILSLVRLNWDRRHVLNNTVTIEPVNGLSFTLVNRLRSGEPYTTERGFVRSTLTNNAARPVQFWSDLRAYYRPSFVKQNLSLFLQVHNLWDNEVVYAVFASTGRVDEDLQKELFRNTGSQIGGLNSLDEFYARPEWVAAPRKISLGLNLKF